MRMARYASSWMYLNLGKTNLAGCIYTIQFRYDRSNIARSHYLCFWWTKYKKLFAKKSLSSNKRVTKFYLKKKKEPTIKSKTKFKKQQKLYLYYDCQWFWDCNLLPKQLKSNITFTFQHFFIFFIFYFFLFLWYCYTYISNKKKSHTNQI